MRSPSCTSACCMWRGFFSSCRYSLSSVFESLRPNHVFHQNRNGISTISHAVTKKRMRWPLDMRRLAGWVAEIVASVMSEIAVSTLHLALDVRDQLYGGWRLAFA